MSDFLSISSMKAFDESVERRLSPSSIQTNQQIDAIESTIPLGKSDVNSYYNRINQVTLRDTDISTMQEQYDSLFVDKVGWWQTAGASAYVSFSDWSVPSFVSNWASKHVVSLVEDLNTPMTSYEWQHSPNFRQGIQYYEGMTKIQGEVLANKFDDREFAKALIERGGYKTAEFTGSVGGMALDPAVYFGGEFVGPALSAVGRFASPILEIGGARFSKLLQLGKLSKAGWLSNPIVRQGATSGLQNATIMGALQPIVKYNRELYGDTYGWGDFAESTLGGFGIGFGFGVVHGTYSRFFSKDLVSKQDYLKSLENLSNQMCDLSIEDIVVPKLLTEEAEIIVYDNVIKYTKDHNRVVDAYVTKYNQELASGEYSGKGIDSTELQDFFSTYKVPIRTEEEIRLIKEENVKKNKVYFNKVNDTLRFELNKNVIEKTVELKPILDDFFSKKYNFDYVFELGGEIKEIGFCGTETTKIGSMILDVSKSIKKDNTTGIETLEVLNNALKDVKSFGLGKDSNEVASKLSDKVYWSVLDNQIDRLKGFNEEKTSLLKNALETINNENISRETTFSVQNISAKDDFLLNQIKNFKKKYEEVFPSEKYKNFVEIDKLINKSKIPETRKELFKEILKLEDFWNTFCPRDTEMELYQNVDEFKNDLDLLSQYWEIIEVVNPAEGHLLSDDIINDLARKSSYFDDESIDIQKMIQQMIQQDSENFQGVKRTEYGDIVEINQELKYDREKYDEVSRIIDPVVSPEVEKNIGIGDFKTIEEETKSVLASSETTEEFRKELDESYEEVKKWKELENDNEFFDEMLVCYI